MKYKARRDEGGLEQVSSNLPALNADDYVVLFWGVLAFWGGGTARLLRGISAEPRSGYVFVELVK